LCVIPDDKKRINSLLFADWLKLHDLIWFDFDWFWFIFKLMFECFDFDE
jgi:hypothetical protein